MTKTDRLLVITSLLNILLLTLHFTSDVLRAKPGNNEGGGSTLVAMPVLTVLLYGTLVLAGRRSGNIIMLIGGLIAALMPVFHVNFPNGFFTGQLARGASGDFIFVWTMHLLATLGLFGTILAIKTISGRSDP